jgi:hypothetical protein
MRFLLLLLLTSTVASNASNWFGANDPQPTPWSQEQLQRAQKAFEGVKEDAFNTWDESRLRQFLLDQGVIEPKGTKEQLQQMVKNQYKAYNSAVSSLSASASTAIYGDSYYQATQSISSMASRSTDSLVGAMNDSKDYIYSTWDDNQLRTWLEQHGYIRTNAQVTRDEMLQKMKETYATAADPVYLAWSDSYMRKWLIGRGIMSEPPTAREKLVTALGTYYYSTKDFVWTSWTDSELHTWLVNHNIIKSGAQIQRDKMMKLVQDNYSSASNAIWDAWTESDMKAWLIEHGYLRSDAQIKRDELVALINSKYTDSANRAAEYLTWPDARLRAYLRQHGIPESQLPTSRPSLLHEVRIRYVITQNRVDAFMQSIRDAVSSSIESAEGKLGSILDMLSGVKDDAEVKRREVLSAAEKKAKEAQEKADELKKEAIRMKNEL